MALIEIIVSAMLLIIVAVGVFAAFDATTRATAQERHRVRANALAQADLERIRSLPIACPTSDPSCTYSVASLVTPQSRNVTQDAFTYTIVSAAEFVTEPATTNTCAAGTGSRDYLRISSRVTWPTMGNTQAPTAASLVTPPSGSVVPNSGSLLVQVDDAASDGIPGVALTGSGAASFSGTTGPSGCVLWRNLPAGNYTMSVGGAASGMVDRDGDPPEPETVSVEAQSTNTMTLLYDDPGSMEVTFTTRRYGDNALVDVSADSVVLTHTGMTMTRFFSVPSPTTVIDADSLFPFTSPYSVFAGTCTGSSASDPGDNPNPTGIDPAPAPAAIPSATVPPGGSLNPGPKIQLPALHVTVYRGTNTSSERAEAATVKVRDLNCGNYLRQYSTNSSGQLSNPGLPYSDYNVCASGVAANGTTRRRTTGTSNNPSLNDGQVDLNSPSTTLNMFLSGGGSQSGSCP